MKHFAKQFLAWSMALSYTVQATAGVEAKPVFTQENAHKWNKVSTHWDNTSERAIKKSLTSLNAKFNPEFSKEDSAYLLVYAAQVGEFPQITKTEKGATFTLKSDPSKKVELSFLGGKKMLLNGKEFTYNEKANLQENIEMIEYTLNLDSAQKVSFFDSLFMPKAEALPAWGWGLIVGIAVFIGINIYNNWDSFKGGVKKTGDGLHDAGSAAVGA